jgi:peptidoglycan/LPS O-acetylase OafA/YrhL
MQKRFLNLDGFRFLAAWIVLVCHLEIFKPYFGIEPISWLFFSNSAQLAVTFFFVLSGFLITWILLAEKNKNPLNKINIPRFYKKRILRTWPLYYLLVLLTFFVLRNLPFFSLPYQHANAANTALFEKRLIGYSFFMPNYTDITVGSQLYLGQSWSLGVEEFFYLFFPLAFYHVKMKNVMSFLLVLIIFFLFLSVGAGAIAKKISSNSNIHLFVSIYTDKYRIYSFLLGGLAAWLVSKRMSSSFTSYKFVSDKRLANLLVLILLVLVAGGITFSILTQQLYSIFFALLLFCVITSEIKFSLLNTQAMIYLGKISYGIYMLHPVAIIITLKLINTKAINPVGILDNILLYAGATVITIVLASISYELYEKYFLKLRK